MKIDPKDFRVPSGKKVRLRKWATDIRPLYKSEKHYKELLASDVAELSAQQRLLYASNGYSVLLIFQAMDAAGKDGAIGHVLTGINPFQQVGRGGSLRAAMIGPASPSWTSTALAMPAGAGGSA